MEPAQRHVSSIHPAFKLISGYRCTVSALLVVCLVLVPAFRAHAQAQVSGVPIATDQSVAASLSNQFGIPAGQAVDQAGDLVFIGRGVSALFFRPAGSGSLTTRLLQVGDEVPGVNGSHVISFANVSINSSGEVVFSVAYTLPDVLPHQALMTYDGSTYHKIVSSDDMAPRNAGAYGTALTPIRANAINDNGDVAFTAMPVNTGLLTLYIAPTGSSPLRIAAEQDGVPPSGTTELIFMIFFSGINSLGQVLFSAETTQGNGLFLGTEANGGQLQRVLLAGDAACGAAGLVSPITTIPGMALSNSGTYAFTEPVGTQSMICTGSAGGSPTNAIASGAAAPAAIGGSLGALTTSSIAIDTSGDIVFTSPITGSATTTSSLLRLHPSGGGLDVIAYGGLAAPGTTASTFSGSFSEFSVSSDGSVGFVGAFRGGGTGLYRQSGTAAPIAVAIGGQSSSPSGGTITQPNGSKLLDSGTLFFTSTVSGGVAYYGQFADDSGTLQQWMSTEDPLPSDSGISLLYGSPQAAGDAVAFGAQKAGGRVSLFSSNSTTGTPTVVVTEGDMLASTGGVIAGPNLNYFVNGNGQVVFATNLVGGSSPSAILAASSTGELSTVAAVGASTPISGTTFTTVTLNFSPPTPINSAGQVAFSGTYSGSSVGSGVFLYSPAGGGSIAKIAATGDPVVSPPGSILSFVGASTSNILALNQSGAVAFGATVVLSPPSSGNRSGFFVGSNGTINKIVTTNDVTAIGRILSPGFLSGFNDSGLLTFTADAVGNISGGVWAVFTGSLGSAPTVIAYSGESAPGGGTLALTTSSQVGNVTVVYTSNNALEDAKGDLAIRAFAPGGAGSGIFLVDAGGAQAGVLRSGILQGTAVPGRPNQTLGLITPNTNVALGPAEQLATVTAYGPPNSVPTNLGMFVLRRDGSLARVLAAGDSVLGGVLSGIRLSHSLAAGSSGKFTFWAAMAGGTVHQAILSTTPGAAVELTSTPNPSVFGIPVTFHATVSTISDQSPTGTVTFVDNNSPLGTTQVDSTGNAIFTTSALAIGDHLLTAQYNGDSNFNPSNSSALTETILPTGAAPVITSASSATFAAGTPSSFTFTVTGVPVPTFTLTGALPSGVTFDPLMGIVSGTPAAESVGNYSLTLTAQNGVLPDASQPFTLTATAVQGAWAGSAGALSSARELQTATLLNNGKVLLAGGVGGSSPAVASLYDPGTGMFISTGSMTTSRSGHTATLLSNGKVLIVGGFGSSGPVASAEIYDSSTGTFISTGNMAVARAGHTATLLDNGKVLIAGGASNSLATASAELYDPASGTFTSTGSMSVVRSSHTATRLSNGKVLIIGGSQDGSPPYPSTSELYDPTTGTFSLSGSLNTPRALHTATLMNDNKILVTGGFNGTSGLLADPELYDVATGTFTAISGMTIPIANHTATLLTNGTVLIAGGFDGDGSSSSALIYDPVLGTFSSTGSMTTPRGSHTATLLTSGKVLVAAGDNVINHALFRLASAEVYDPASFTPPGLVSIAVTPQNISVVSGGTQSLIATGTFSDNSTQQLLSAIWSSSDSSIATVSNDSTNQGVAYVVAQSGSVTISACTGSVCGPVALTVSAAPSITSAGHVTFTVKTPGTFTVTATGFPAPTFAESGALPRGVAFNPSTGLLSGIPAADTDGTYNLTFTALNGVGSDAVQNFTLTVLPTPHHHQPHGQLRSNSTTLTAVFSNRTGRQTDPTSY